MPDETARCESAEEAGLLRARGQLLTVVVLPPTGGWPSKVGLTFSGGTVPADTPIRLEPAEHTEHGFASLDHWRGIVAEWTWLRLQACERARATGTTQYLKRPPGRPPHPVVIPNPGPAQPTARRAATAAGSPAGTARRQCQIRLRRRLRDEDPAVRALTLVSDRRWRCDANLDDEGACAQERDSG